MRYRRRRLPFKACKKCKMLVDYDVERCPRCSSTSFSDDWEGMVIVVRPQSSSAAEIIEVKDSGRFAIKVR